MMPAAKFNDNVNVLQLIIAVVSIITPGIFAFYAQSEQVARNEERIESIRYEVEKAESQQDQFEDAINVKLDAILKEVTEVKIQVVQKEDRRK